MGLIQDIENRLLEAIKRLFNPIITPLVKLWNLLKDFFTALVELVPAIIELVKSVIDEVEAWRNFKEEIHFKTGVINLQSVRDRIEELITELIDAWHALQDLFTSGFKLPVRGVKEAADALEEVVVAFEDFFGDIGLRAAIKRMGAALEKVGGKVFEVLALIQAVAEEALKVVRELQSIVNAVRDVRQTFQTGEGLFLSQKNPRKVIKLDGGGSIKIRVGNLHS